MDWINWNTVIIFGGIAVFAHFGNQAVALLASVFAREQEEEKE